MQAEVRILAGATLSGMLRGMSEQDTAALRAELLTAAAQVLTPARKRGPAAQPVNAAGNAKAQLKRHAVVQVSLTLNLVHRPDYPAGHL